MKTILFVLTLALTLVLFGCRMPEQFNEMQDVHIEEIAWNH
mgnify:FL=1|jgi:hypothetical protein|nr:MAG TPA: PROTEIN (ALPHA-2U-GLOBULIN)-GLOBULIN, LIPID BINDING PROTEIN.5A [Caudoviricetes sp.]